MVVLVRASRAFFHREVTNAEEGGAKDRDDRDRDQQLDERGSKAEGRAKAEGGRRKAEGNARVAGVLRKNSAFRLPPFALLVHSCLSSNVPAIKCPSVSATSPMNGPSGARVTIE